MDLSLSEIKKLITGAVYFTENDGKLCPYRFTKEQLALYETVTEDFSKKSKSASNIRLEFETDSSSLSLALDLSSGASRSFFSIDIYVNGSLHLTEKGTMGEGVCNKRIDAQLGCGNKKVSVYLPWTAKTDIISLSLDDGASFNPIKRELKMICFGDSITQGYDAYTTSFTYASRLCDMLRAEMVNKGIGGERFRPELAACKDDFEPDIITIAYGTNDWRHSTKEEFDFRARAFYENVSNNYPNAKIFALAPLWRGQIGKIVANLGEFFYVRENLKGIAESLPNVTFIDCYDFIPKEADFFSPDKLHPNDEGFRHYAHNLYAEIKKYL